MTRYNWASVEREQVNPLFARQMVHGDKMTVARIQLAKGCLVPEHSHANEQITMLEQGRLLFRISGTELTLEAGDVLHIAAHEPHSAEALEDCRITDLFSPVREDWRRGDDAYLRK
jgi:quercetin dioxygenase-like cupin family protein